MPQTNAIQSTAGINLAYHFTDGNGPVTVFLPGYKSDMSGTKAKMLQALCLEHNFPCLLFDYSGHGVSGGEFVDGTISRWTQDVIEVITAVVAYRQVILVGSSMGGWVMLLAAIKLKKQVSAILGIAIAPDFTEELMWGAFSERQKDQLILEGVLALPSDYDEPYLVTYQSIVDGRKNLLLNNDINITCAARFIHGMEDKDVPWETSMRTLSRLKSTDVQLRLLKDGDHRLSNDAQLKIIEDMLLDIYVTFKLMSFDKGC